jgi:hypothetical protein
VPIFRPVQLSDRPRLNRDRSQDTARDRQHAPQASSNRSCLLCLR